MKFHLELLRSHTAWSRGYHHCAVTARSLQRRSLKFPTFLMSFAASHSGCQASTKIGATPAHTGKVHTQVVLCLCFVLTERTRQASCCTSGRRELNFALTWFAFVFGSKTWLEKWQLSHGFAVDGAYFLGFSTFLSEKMQLSHGFAVGQSIFPWFRHVGS